MGFLFEKRIGQVNMDLLFIRYKYQTKDNQQRCSRLSNLHEWTCDASMEYKVAIWLILPE